MLGALKRGLSIGWLRVEIRMIGRSHTHKITYFAILISGYPDIVNCPDAFLDCRKPT